MLETAKKYCARWSGLKMPHLDFVLENENTRHPTQDIVSGVVFCFMSTKVKTLRTSVLSHDFYHSFQEKCCFLPLSSRKKMLAIWFCLTYTQDTWWGIVGNLGGDVSRNP